MTQKQRETLSCVRTQLKNFLPTHPLAEWLNQRVAQKFEPFYASIDLRDAGFKLAPVDANLFPAGFNNVCETDLGNTPQLLYPHLTRHAGFMPKKIAILPEAHTKNKFYTNNLIELRNMFSRLGVEVHVGWWDAALVVGDGSASKIELESSDGVKISAYPFFRKADKLFMNVDGTTFEPEFIVVNNDFSSGYPKELEGISQHIEPSPKLGWHTRKKSDFFRHYNKLAKELATEAGLDPWCMQVETRLVTGVDFDQQVGIEKIASAVDDLVASIAAEYQKRGIDEKPFVFVKSNQGTYGMGIMKVSSGEELRSMNRRDRNKMAVVKNKLEVHEVIVQEGIPTRFEFEGVISEPAIYLLGRELMGGFLRQNPERGRDENLNSKGMIFKKLCVSDLREAKEMGEFELELVYGTIAQLSAAAISLELKETFEKH